MDFDELIKQTRGRRSLLQALGVAAVGISFGGLAACSKDGGKTLANGEEAKINFYNWDTYIGENTLDNFKEDTGVDVKMDLRSEENKSELESLTRITYAVFCLNTKKNS